MYKIDIIAGARPNFMKISYILCKIPIENVTSTGDKDSIILTVFSSLPSLVTLENHREKLQ